MAMRTEAEYRAKAAQLTALADEAADSQRAAALRELAGEWTRLADVANWQDKHPDEPW